MSDRKKHETSPIVLTVTLGKKAVEYLEAKGMRLSYVVNGTEVEETDPLLLRRIPYDKTPFVKIISGEFDKCLYGLTGSEQFRLLMHIVTTIERDCNYIRLDPTKLSEKIGISRRTIYTAISSLIANGTLYLSSEKHKYWVDINRFRNGFSSESILKFIENESKNIKYEIKR